MSWNQLVLMASLRQVLFIYLSSFENVLKVLFIPINNKSLLKNLCL